MNTIVRTVATTLAGLSLVAVGAASAMTPAHAATPPTTVETAAQAFGLTQYREIDVRGNGNITDELAKAVAADPTAGGARIVHLPAKSFTVTKTLRPVSDVYLVAEPGTTVTWAGNHDWSSLLNFTSTSSGGVYGGTWSGAGQSDFSVVTANAATVHLIGSTIVRAGKYGVVGYKRSALTLENVTTSGAKLDGVHLEGSTLTASGLSATGSRRNGVQISSGSTATISNSTINSNGQAVSGSTTGKVGHGLGVSASKVTVSATSLSKNKVCGLSISNGGTVVVTGSTLNSNGRHGVGTTPGAKVTLTRTTVSGNGYNGVLASGSRTSITLDASTIASPKQYGVSVNSGARVSLTGTTVSRAGKSAIAASGKSAVTLAGGNTISRAKAHGIAISGKASLTVTDAGNLIVANRGDGLLVSGSGTRGTIQAVVGFDGNGKNAILVNSKARLALVSCTFTNTKGKKIAVKSGGKVTKLR